MKHKLLMFSTLCLVLVISTIAVFLLHTDRFYTHLFYIPIVMSALWCPKYTLPIGSFFAIFHVLIESIYAGELNTAALVRAVVIVFVSYCLYLLHKESKKSHMQIQQLNYASNHDALTGIYNRRFFELALKQSYDLPIVLFVCDIDYLKKWNDHYGHPIGDMAIVQTSALLQGALRNDDILARLGGDEFGIIAHACPQTEVHAIITRIKDAFQVYNEMSEYDFPLSVSIGYAIAHQHTDLTSLLKKADTIMYVEKKKIHKDS